MAKRTPDDAGFYVNLGEEQVFEVKTISQAKNDTRVKIQMTSSSGMSDVRELIIRSDRLLSKIELEQQVLEQLHNLRNAAAHEYLIGRFGIVEKDDYEAQPIPPGTFFLDLLVDPKVAKDWRVNAEEVYVDIWYPRHGRKKANLIWYGQIARTIISQWLNPIMAIIDRVKRKPTA